MCTRADRFQGNELPRVRFLNGAEVEVLPCSFSSTLPNVGTVKRLQVRRPPL